MRWGGCTLCPGGSVQLLPRRCHHSSSHFWCSSRAGLKPGICLDENCPVFMLKSHDACFQINPVRALKHTPAPTPQCRLSSSLSPTSCWPQHTTQAGPRDRPISKLTLQKQQVCVHVCRERTELSQFPLWLAVVAGCAPVAAAGRIPF